MTAMCRRVVHRDLKPENILLDDAGSVKIGDFGLAGMTTPFSGRMRLMCGTPEFAAPEIVQGNEYNGPAVDVWSMGVILYEILQASAAGRADGRMSRRVDRWGMGTILYETLPASAAHGWMSRRIDRWIDR
jgi:serine/threonine protein kinase